MIVLRIRKLVGYKPASGESSVLSRLCLSLEDSTQGDRPAYCDLASRRYCFAVRAEVYQNEDDSNGLSTQQSKRLLSDSASFGWNLFNCPTRTVNYFE